MTMKQAIKLVKAELKALGVKICEVDPKDIQAAAKALVEQSKQ